MRLVALRYAAVVAIVVPILCLENFPTVLRRLSGVNETRLLVARATAYLIPEYVAVAIPIALFLGTALAFRRLAMSGELDVFGASGFGPRRMLLAPAALGLLSFALLVGIRFYVQPAGEKALDRIGYSVAGGQFGIPLKPRIANVLPPDKQIYFDHVTSGGVLIDVIVDLAEGTLAAQSASLARAADGRLLVRLESGVAVWRTGAGVRRVQFRSLFLAMPLRIQVAAEMKPARDRLDRLSLPELLAVRRSGLSAARVAASAAGRLAAAGLCLCLPMLGFALGVPPKRSSTGIGLGVGLLLIVLYWKIGASVEDHLTRVSPLADAGILIACCLGASALVSAQAAGGVGSIERFLATRLHAIGAWSLRTLGQAT